MGASTSVRRDGKSGDTATAEEQNVLPNGGDNVDSKLLPKNGKLSGLNGKADDQIEGFDGRSGEKVVVKVGQMDSVLVSQKDDILEVMEVLQDEITTRPAEKEISEMTNLTLTEEKVTKEEPGEASEVGFKKIFRFVGFKFTLKKNKTENPGPVQLTVNKVDAEKASGPESTAKMAEELDDGNQSSEPASEGIDKDTSEQSVKHTENTEEITPEAEHSTSPIVQEIQSPLKRLFARDIFSSSQRPSFKKPAEEALLKEKVARKGFNKEKADSLKNSTEEEARPEQEQTTTPDEPKVGPLTKITLAAEEKQNEGEIEAKSCTSTQPADTVNGMKATEEESEETVTEQTSLDNAVTVLTTEAGLLSCQESVRNHGSPLKKLFTGTGLKKRSKKLKGKRAAESKFKSGEHAAEQLQSAKSPRIDSSFSSPEVSIEHANGDPLQTEPDGDRVTSDEERKRDGIQPWSSFKKLMTPKKRAKIYSESEDEGAEKPKTGTLSSIDNSQSTKQQEEQKSSEEELKTEFSTEEPPKKKESSMSWEALFCRGSAKKRARKISDSDGVDVDEESGGIVGSPIGSSQDGEHELLTSSPDQTGSPSEGDGGSTWASLKRLVTPRRRVKSDDRSEDSAGLSAEQVSSDSEMPKEDTSFSLKRLIPGCRKKGLEQVSSGEAGKDFESAEEDSDTPAVVPLSEFDLTEFEQVVVTPKEEAVEKQMDTTEPEVTKHEPVVILPHETLPTEVEQAQDTLIAGMEKQQASWILTTAEVETEDKTECITKHQQLSDIPEEGAIEDTTVTPKSTTEEVCQDDTITEDIIELTSEAVTAPELSEESFADESTEMVSAVSRLTDSPGTTGETTPVVAEYELSKTKAVLQEAVETISLSVDIITASKDVGKVFVTQIISETIASDIGRDSQEIQPVEEDQVKISVESIPEISKVLSAEIVYEAKNNFVVVGVAQDEVYEAQVEVVMENVSTDNAWGKTSVNLQQRRPVQKSVVNLEHVLVEDLDEQVVTDKPRFEPEQEEEPACSQSAQITDVPIVKGEHEHGLDRTDKSEANVKNFADVLHCLREEFSDCMSEPTTAETAEDQETSIDK
ncbi:A-kinase anchor protein 12 [Conger conger]|uniref:A-kinase anchor protein 12 n=1 Tax=Conger conger TaxID=82655 RepID=UPI002A5AF21B|nr:A-kinase anchor protein 12 [Conger conger]